MRKVLALSFAAASISAWAAMPTSEQNALVKKYCAVCHSDAAKNGGLSLEHYDAAKPDPGLAAMILSKLNNGAMGAAGNGVPDKAAQQAWLDSTREQAVGAKEWFVSREHDAVSASIVREVARRKSGSTDAPIYRMLVACNVLTGIGEMQLTWSPEPQTGRTIAVSVDEKAPVEYKIEGSESMGNGASLKSGHASIVISSGKHGRLALPKDSLIIRELFPGESVQFSCLVRGICGSLIRPDGDGALRSRTGCGPDLTVGCFPVFPST
jgi:hypothetical protein